MNELMPNTVDQEAADWLARLDANSHTSDSPDAIDLRNRFEAWLAANPGHRAAHARLQAAWGRLDRLQSLHPAADRSANPDLLAFRKSATSAMPATPLSRMADLAGRARYAIAAALAFFVIGAGVLYWQFDTDSDIRTGVGERRHMVLKDGSHMDLNSQSHVAVNFQPDLRRVELNEGEAIFKVAHDESRPFVVVANGLTVRAIGTAFSVRVKAESVEVVVSEGIVGVTPAGKTEVVMSHPQSRGTSQKLTAGHVAVYGASADSQQGVVRVITTTEIDRKLAWQRGMIAFEGEPLSEAVAEFNRYNLRKLVITDPELLSVRVGGYFKSDDVDTFVKALDLGFGIAAVNDGEKVTYLAPARK